MIRHIAAFDLHAFQCVLTSPRHHRLLPWARLVSASADGWLYLPALPLLLFLCHPGNLQPLMLLLVFGFVLERCTYYVLKNTFQRARPAQTIARFRAEIAAGDKYSLPSGHTSAAFFSCTFLCLSLGPGFLPLFLWASSVGASRVILGVHFPIDILSGALLGCSVAFLIL